MGLLDFLRKGNSKIKVETNELEISFKSKVSTEMIQQLQEAIKKGEGDPFREYRKRKILPEKFMYGMNCYFDALNVEYGDEYAQRVYEEIRKDSQAYSIQEDTSGVDIPGVPILFIVELQAALRAENKVIKELRFEKALPWLVQVVIQCEPEPESIVRLDSCMRIINEEIQKYNQEYKKTEEPFVVFKARLEKIKNFSSKLTSGMILYKSKIAEYYNFLILDRIVSECGYGPNNRKVPLSYCIDESNELILMTIKSIKEKYFKEDKELLEEDMRNMDMVYRYKPYEETLKKAYTNPLSIIPDLQPSEVETLTKAYTNT